MPNRTKLAIAAIVVGVGIALTWFHAIQGAAFSVVQGAEHGPALPPPAATPEEQPLAAPSSAGDAAPSAPLDDAAPTSQRTLACDGRVVDARRFPVAGALVSLFLPGLGSLDAETGADGGFALALPRRVAPAGRGGVYATDGERAAVRGCDAAGSERLELGTLALEDAQALTVRVRRAGHPAPGASVRLYATPQRWPLFVRRADDAGRALFPPLPRGEVFVEASASGAAGRAALFMPQTGGAELLVELLPTRVLELEVTSSLDGAPIAGATFVLHERLRDTDTAGSETNDRVCLEIEVPPSDPGGRSRIVALPSDGSFSVTVGAAGFLTAHAAAVLHDTRELAFTLTPGSDPVDDVASRAAARLAGDEAPARTLTLRIQLDGRPGLPPDYRLDGPPGLRLLGEDPLTAEVVVALPHAAVPEPPLRLEAPGFLPVELAPAGSIVDVELQRASELIGHVVPPAVGHALIVAQRLDPASGSWQELDIDGLRAPNGPEGSFCFTRLAAGTYRIQDERTQRSSNELTLPPGGRGEVFLDLGGVQWVEGRVELPSAADARLVRIQGLAQANPVPAPALCGSAPPAGVVPRADGTFELLHPGEDLLTLWPWHPYFVHEGEAVLRTGRSGVVLRLVPGDDVLVPLSTILDDLRDATGVRVLVYDGEPTGQPLVCIHAAIVDGMARFNGAGRGRRTLWLDPGAEHAPAVLRDVQLSAGTTLLAEPLFSTGSILRVRVPGAAQAPPLWISAQRIEEPSYERTIAVDRGQEAVLAGLGPGTFTVRIEPLDAPEQALERTLELDGARIVELELPTLR